MAWRPHSATLRWWGVSFFSNASTRGATTMGRTTRICGGALAFGLAGLWGSSAGAEELPPQQPIEPSCHPCSVCTTVRTPARYTNGSAGEVALIKGKGSAASDDMAEIAVPLGL